MQGNVVTSLAVVLLLGVLIFVHELGHYLVAKLLRVKVLRFSIGFGPPVFSFRRGETEYRVAWIPLGGYVKMAGDDPHAEVAPEDRGRGFLEQPPWKRLLIAVAGPTMNLLLPFVLFLGLVWAALGERTVGATVGTVLPGSPAARAGLAAGDRIASVTGPDGTTVRIRDWEDLQDAFQPLGGAEVTIRVDRGGTLLPMAMRVQEGEQTVGLETMKRGVIGVMPMRTPARVGPVEPGAPGALQPFDLVVSAGGAPIKNAVELQAALEAAQCRPVDLEVIREHPRELPGAYLADHRRERLAGVPTCRDGSPTMRIVDPWVAASVAVVEPGGPADRAGIRRGDVVTAVNGRPVHTFNELGEAVNRELAGGNTGTFTLAGGRTVTMAAKKVVTKHEVKGTDQVKWSIGLDPPREALVAEEAYAVRLVPYERGPAEVLVMAVRETVGQIRTLVLGIVMIFTREVDSSQVGSILQIVEVTARAVEQGWSVYFQLMAFISVNLAIMNLLPIPVLDGGHIAQSVVETVTRRPLSVRMREIANVFGLILLLGLMAFAFRNDIVRLIDRSRNPPIEEPMR